MLKRLRIFPRSCRSGGCVFLEKNTILSLQRGENQNILYDIARENASVAQLVEHHVANVIVAGSNPVTRSIFLPFQRPLPYAILFHARNFGGGRMDFQREDSRSRAAFIAFLSRMNRLDGWRHSLMCGLWKRKNRCAGNSNTVARKLPSDLRERHERFIACPVDAGFSHSGISFPQRETEL